MLVIDFRQIPPPPPFPPRCYVVLTAYIYHDFTTKLGLKSELLLKFKLLYIIYFLYYYLNISYCISLNSLYECIKQHYIHVLCIMTIL